MGEFDVDDKAIEAIERKLEDGEIVVIDKTVAFATYPVGNHKSTDDTWNAVNGRDCAATKKLVSRVICAAGGEYQRYWKNLRPMFSTIARQKLDVVRGVFSNSDYKNSAASFCTVHADATSYMMSGHISTLLPTPPKPARHRSKAALQTIKEHQRKRKKYHYGHGEAAPHFHMPTEPFHVQTAGLRHQPTGGKSRETNKQE